MCSAREGVPADQLACCIDATFKLVKEGWTISTVGCNTLYEDGAGIIRNKFRPFLHLLSKTEQESGYAFLFRTLVQTCYPMLGLDSSKSGFMASVSDHHDGLINACIRELHIGAFALCIIICYIDFFTLTQSRSVFFCAGHTSLAPL